jgi:hypothetical protein
MTKTNVSIRSYKIERLHSEGFCDCFRVIASVSLMFTFFIPYFLLLSTVAIHSFPICLKTSVGTAWSCFAEFLVICYQRLWSINMLFRYPTVGPVR